LISDVSLVFFDFDGTLTTRDTIWPFGLFLARSAHADSSSKAIRLLLLIAFLKFRVLSNDQFKRRFCDLLLRNRSEQEMRDIADAFASSVADTIVNQETVDAMRRHLHNGDQVYILSSNFSLVLRPWQQTWGAAGVIATEAETADGCFTGRVVGRACDGREKLSRALALFGAERLEQATAYGDSRSDRYIMEYVKKAIWV
jgi:phosphatidylglycerophosphatase C